MKKIKKSEHYHHGRLKESLILTALKMLKTQSPDQISLRKLAQKAGVSQAAPYRHFKSKEDLFAAISQQGFELKFKYMEEAILKYQHDPLEMFFQCGLAYFRMGLERPQHFRMMLTGVIPGPEFPELKMSASKTFVLLRDMIQTCQKAKVLGPGDPYHKAMNCWAVVNGFTVLYVEQRLAWTGVNSLNAEKALRSLLSQYLFGASTELKSTETGFQPFTQNQETREQKEKMETIRFLNPESR